MIPFKKFLPAVFLLFSINIYAQDQDQDIYDYSHTLRYAHYLFISQNFTQAADEFERLLFMDPENDSISYFLLKSYRLDHNFNKGITRAERIFPDVTKMPESPALEYAKLNMLQGNYAQTLFLLNHNSKIAPSTRSLHRLNVSMLQTDLKQAHEVLRHDSIMLSNVYTPYMNLIYQGNHLKHKSPGLAMAFSAVVPGSGKLYSRDYKDAVVSFIFVGMSAFQAYRGFDKRGADSAYTWIYTGLAAGFYIGNIYGAYKSAKDFNLRQKSNYEKRVRDFIYPAL